MSAEADLVVACASTLARPGVYPLASLAELAGRVAPAGSTAEQVETVARSYRDAVRKVATGLRGSGCSPSTVEVAATILEAPPGLLAWWVSEVLAVLEEQPAAPAVGPA